VSRPSASLAGTRTDRDRIPIVFAAIGLDRRHYGEDRHRKANNQQEAKSNHQQSKECTRKQRYERRNLEVDSLLALLINERVVLSLEEPDNKWAHEEAYSVTEQPNEGNDVTDHCPLSSLSGYAALPCGLCIH
jgi:hypothetical protein